MTDLMLSTAAEAWPTFSATEEHEFVETWRTLDESVEGHKWQQAAIACAYAERFGREALKEFADKMPGVSRRRVQEYEFTYRNWRAAPCERSRVLSFHHHTIMARAILKGYDAEEIITVAETPEIENPDGSVRAYPLSTRELDAYVKTGVLPDGNSPASDRRRQADSVGAAGEATAGEATATPGASGHTHEEAPLTQNEAYYLYELTMREYDEQAYAIAAADNAILVIAAKLKKMAGV